MELELGRIDAFQKFTGNEAEVLREFVEKVEFLAGDIIFRQGDKSDTVFFIAKGRALIRINTGNGGPIIKLSVLCPGTVFGEMALIDGNPRSAEAVALDGLVCYVLDAGQLARLGSAHPEIAYKIIIGIGHDMAKRIRIINGMLSAMRG